MFFVGSVLGTCAVKPLESAEVSKFTADNFDNAL
jgi:hypothetical protein